MPTDDTHWPDGTERVFGGRTDGQRTAARVLGMSLSAYAAAYRSAAEQLFDGYVARGVTDNFMVFPLAFLWRHYLELTLKALWEVMPSAPDFPNEHSLLKLWEPIEKYVVARWPASGENGFVASAIKKVHEVDPDGDGFRYPMRRNRSPNLTKLPQAVNVEEFDRSMRRVANLLDATWSQLADELDAVPPGEP